MTKAKPSKMSVKDLEQFLAVVRAIEEFWITIVKLPAKVEA